jgi:hypothetical protein
VPGTALAAVADVVASAAVDVGDLELGGGLLAILRPALATMVPGASIALLSSSPAVEDDLRSFCRVEHHQYSGAAPVPLAEGAPPRWRHLIVRGPRVDYEGDPEPPITLPQRDGRLLASDVLATVPMPSRAAPTSGFAPRGAQVEKGSPSYPFTLLERDRVAPPEVAQLYDQAVSAQWDATRDIPWASVRPLPRALEQATAQIMTFLAQNELSALYVPARFIPRVHPAYAEVSMFLASQLADEARHIDVFLKRARAAGGHAGVSTVTTSRSLLSLLQLEDFTTASFLLSVLGEGTFLDLLNFVEDHAPDEATRILARRARTDEARHVHFGLCHVRHVLETDETAYARLEAAVRERGATLHEAGAGVPVPVADALTIYAARGDDPPSVRRGHQHFRALLETMHASRIKRLEHAGFSRQQAETLSGLHTPNFM